ncbi:MAG: inorganic diphosphatase [Acidimicrobiaceae bacterium]|nr:inorganic diphosphatase [Acidimicrobiaceae bacterium]
MPESDVTGHDDVEAIIEIPKGGRNKYEYDAERGVIFLDRRLFSATVYPSDYGFIPDTLAEDGDSLDVLVIVDDSTFPGCHIMIKPVGVFRMSDEHGPDNKILGLPANDPQAQAVDGLEQLPPLLIEEIAHFFHVYKDLEPGKDTVVHGFAGADEAWAEIEACRERYRSTKQP